MIKILKMSNYTVQYLDIQQRRI